jgi:hypothetical protein
MKLVEEIEIREIYHLKHRNDNLIHRHFNWEDNLINKTTSPYIFRNDTMKKYLSHIQKMVSVMVQSTAKVRNFFNFTVDKYYNDHWG